MITRSLALKRLTCGYQLTYQCFRSFSTTPSDCSSSTSQDHDTSDPRLKNLGPVIEDQYATIRSSYEAPKYPILLAHGLLGFDELHIAGSALPGIQYWRGIVQALAAKGVEVITASVPASGSFERRAQRLKEVVEERVKGRKVNIVGGLDSRYMISHLKPSVDVLSLTTIATPHRGSAFADHVFHQIGPRRLKTLYKIFDNIGIETGAFQQLTQEYMRETFNPSTPDVEGVRYFSYGSTLNPSLFSVFRQSHAIIAAREGPNDGLVSVDSAQWGEYKGTLVDVSHLDLINWTNRVRWWIWEMTGGKRNFNAVAFYLDIADMLAKEGL